MKKQLLSLMLMLVGTIVWAQSGWTDPSSEYQAQTVVYVTIQANNYDLFYTEEGDVAFPEVGAFIEGELRGWADIDNIIYHPETQAPLFSLRVGGVVGTDEDKEISFRLYDSKTGIVYPLYCEEGGVTWNGDVTPVYPSECFVLTFEPARSVKLYKLEGDVEEEVTELTLYVNEEFLLDGYVAKLVNSDGIPVEVVTEGEWDIQYNPNMPYVSRVESTNGEVVIKGMRETPLSEETGENRFMEGIVNYVIGNFYATIPVRVLPQYIAVTSLDIDDINYYWPGYGRLYLGDDMVTYNNGESFPSNPGVKIISSSNEDVVDIVSNQGLNYKGIGSSVITVAAIDDETITTTFTINILSALEGLHMDGFDADVPYYHYERYSDSEEFLQLPTPIFDWKLNEEGYPIIDELNENYTLSSSDESILQVVETPEAGLQIISLKKGTVTVTYTSEYDRTKTVDLIINITQSPFGVAITKIGNIEIETNTPVEPVVNIAVGQTVSALAQVNPEDADVESFTMEVVDSDDIPLGDDVVVVNDFTLNNGVAELSFTFTAAPNVGSVYVKATVNNDFSHRVRLNVKQSVASIELDYEPGVIWLGADETYTFSISPRVLPEDTSDKSLIVTSSNEDVIVAYEGLDGAYPFEVVGKGSSTLTFTSVDNPSVSVSCEVTVKRKVEELWVEGVEYELYNDGIPTYAFVTIYPSDADFDREKLHYRTEIYSDFNPEGWEFVTIEEGDVMDDALQFIITGRSLCNFAGVVFEYNTTEQEGYESFIQNYQEVCVKERVRFNTGWNWVSFVSAGLSVYEMEGALEEARSQYNLVINDPVWGLFGTLDWMDPYEAYKINMKEEAEVLEYILYEGGYINGDGSVDDKILEHGWNWESYPYEYAYDVEDIFDAAQFSEGDIILSKEDGMVTLIDGVWEGNLTTLRPNQGYLIYSNVESGHETSVTMPNRYTDLEQGFFEDGARARSLHRPVWNYDGSRFANVMAIVGKVNIDDTEDYTIGAFVGDECRGTGKFVNGKAYVTAAGKAGDIVTLRLCNEWTGEYIEVLGEVTFADMAGTAKEPIPFNVVETGVGSLAVATLTIQSNVAYASGDIQVYDIQGKIVAEGYKRVDFGHLSQGVYLVKSGDESRKVVK